MIINIIYFLIILFFIILTLKFQRKQEVENFLDFKSSRIKYNECRENCLVKYDDKEQLKVCKKYCKCKKTNNFNKKKYKKKCNDLKENLYKYNNTKYSKLLLKNDLKKLSKEKKNNKKKEELKLNKINSNKDNKKYKKQENYFNNIVNKYMTDENKIDLYNINRNTKSFLKEIKNIFTLNK